MEKIKVLIIEDNEGNWLAAKTSLRRHAVCRRAQTVAEGLRLFAKEDFDLVLLDLHLPEEPGFSFVKKVRQGVKHPRIPVFAVSAFVQIVHQKEAMKVGCNGFIPKPFTRGELINCLTEYLPHE